MTFTSFTPLQYLMIDIASNFGLDRETWETRLDWFAQNEVEIQSLADLAISNPNRLSSHRMMKEADASALFFAGVQAWDKAKRGLPISYPISLDATCSGGQLMAVLLGCEKSAEMCNVVDTGKREDFYTAIHQGYAKRSPNPGQYDRAKLKAATVPWFYGSEKEPQRIFGADSEDLAIYMTTLEEEAPGIQALRDALISLWNPTALSQNWVLPDNFHVKVKVMKPREDQITFLGQPYAIRSYENRATEQGISNAAHVIHSCDGMVVREVSRRCSYDASKLAALLPLLNRATPMPLKRRSPSHDLVETLWNHYLKTGFLSVRILELLDEENLHLVDKDVLSAMVETLPDAPFPVLSVHDAFRVHPNNANDLRRQYNQILHDLAQSNLLASIASQITGEPTTVSKYGDFSAKVLEANYALS